MYEAASWTASPMVPIPPRDSVCVSFETVEKRNVQCWSVQRDYVFAAGAGGGSRIQGPTLSGHVDRLPAGIRMLCVVIRELYGKPLSCTADADIC